MPTAKTEKRKQPATPEDHQVRSWVQEARAGNRRAFEHLANHYYGEIFRMMYYRTQSRVDAEDITQEIFLKAYKGLGRLTDENRFKGWLYRIAINRVKDFHRRKKFRKLFKPLSHDIVNTQIDIQESPEPDPFEALTRKRFRQESEKFMARLSKTEKHVFTLRFFDQLTTNEMATALRKSESTIKTHLYRALAKFKHDSIFRSFLKGE